MDSLNWIVAHVDELVIATLAILLAVEAVVRGLESLAKVLMVVAKWTKTTKDDEALVGVAKHLHGAAEWLAEMTAWLRPFSLRGTARAPKMEAILVEAKPGVEQPPRPPIDDVPTNPGGAKRSGFANLETLALVGLLAFVVLAALTGSGCGGGMSDLDPEEVHAVGCELTEDACDVCERAQTLYCSEDSAAKNDARCTATGVLCTACALSERLFCSGGEPPPPAPSSGGELPAGSGGV